MTFCDLSIQAASILWRKKLAHTKDGSVDHYSSAWQHWHDRRIAELGTRHGWLSVTGLRWLVPGARHHWDDVMGTWEVGNDGWVSVTLGTDESGGPTAEALALASDPQTSREVRLGDPERFRARLDEGASLLWFSDASVVYELIRRGGHYGVRLRDSRSPLLRSFVDVPTFPVDPAWAIAGSFVPEAPHEVPIDSAWPGLGLDATVTGAVEFTYRGSQYRLRTTGDPATGLTVAFHDATNTVTTPAWRQLSLGVPGPDGQVTIDFNRSTDYPFAFTSFATCPAPVAGNVLPFAVEAGEKTPRQTLGDFGVTTPVLVIENDRVSPLGRLEGWLADEGLDVEVVRPWNGDEIPAMFGYRAVILLGGRPSPSSIERAPWLPDEVEYVRELIGTDVPVLGICLGAQLLALAAGGSVSEGDAPEVGYREMRATSAAAKDPLFAGVPAQFSALHFHRDRVSALPDGATLLAGNDTTAIQAFRIEDNAWGVQFHPEWGAEHAAEWKNERIEATGFDPASVRAAAERVDERWTHVWRDFARRFAAYVKAPAPV